jgi:hypothetical protein
MEVSSARFSLLTPADVITLLLDLAGHVHAAPAASL